MRGKKLNQLFQAARRFAAPAPAADFADGVVRALRREPRRSPPVRLALLDELNIYFPRLAVAAVMVLALGVAANLALGTPEWADLSDGLAQISTQYFLPLEGF